MQRPLRWDKCYTPVCNDYAAARSAEISRELRGLAACKTLAKQAGEKRSMQRRARVNADASLPSVKLQLRLIVCKACQGVAAQRRDFRRQAGLRDEHRAGLWKPIPCYTSAAAPRAKL